MEPPDPLLVLSAKAIGELAVKGYIAKELVQKLLGPTAEYLGEQVSGLAKKCNINVDRIFTRAARKAGSRLDEPGAVPPRVLRGVINEGAFVEDEVASEYFGGILASSRTQDGKDDRGVAFVALIRDLSTYQLKLHYLLYRSVRRFFRGSGLRVGVPVDRARMRVFIPLAAFAEAVDTREEDLASILEHVVHGIARSSLIDSPYFFGKEEYLKSGWSEAKAPGLLLVPSAYGAELFMWAHGLGHMTVGRFLDDALVFDQSDEADVPAGIVNVPLEEDLADLRREGRLAGGELDAFVEKMKSHIEQGRALPAFPNDLREHVRHIAERDRELTDGVSAFFIEQNLDRCLRPDDDVTPEKLLELVKALRSQLNQLAEPAKKEAE